ncbi:T-cell surface antigen CD2-like [Pelmatolapia mariae]|uniref:T-cell surface antigen CD2-like n=1 Tax=Pelmatolapia mariae TaxID=158779 RepID=UPI002FE5F8D4
MKKMPSAATIVVFLLSFFSIVSTGSQDDCVYAATGSSFTVSLRYELKESESLRWRKDTRVIFYRRQKQVIEGKNYEVDSAGSLKLTQLAKDKSGRYTPEVINEDGLNVGGNLPSVRLCVLDRVQKPTVMMTCTDNGRVNFTCSVGHNETITWFMGGEMLEEKGKTLTRVAKDVLNANFSCNVSNPVSSEISPPVQQNCYKPVQKPHVTVNCTGESEVTFTCSVSQKDNNLEFKWFNEYNKPQGSGETLTRKTVDVVNTNFFCNVSNSISSEISDPAVQKCSKPSFPNELFGISIWVFIGGGAGLLILVIVTATVCCVRARRKRRI